jgi:di/tricarboxylate transporter
MLWWLLLVPYFWVKSLNSRPFFGTDREFANRVNGLLALALVFTFVVLGALNLTSLRYLLQRTAFGLAVYTVGCVMAALLVSRERERRYLALYHAMPPAKRRAFGIGVLVVFAVGFVAALWPINTHATATKPLSCPTGSVETTAECS